MSKIDNGKTEESFVDRWIIKSSNRVEILERLLNGDKIKILGTTQPSLEEYLKHGVNTEQ